MGRIMRPYLLLIVGIWARAILPDLVWQQGFLFAWLAGIALWITLRGNHGVAPGSELSEPQQVLWTSLSVSALLAVLASAAWTGLTLNMLGPALLSGWFESLFFYVWMQEQLDQTTRRWSLLVTAALYVGYHLPLLIVHNHGAVEFIQSVPLYMIVGLAFGGLYRLERSLLVLWPLTVPISTLFDYARVDVKVATGTSWAATLLVALASGVWLVRARKRLAQRREAPVSTAAYGDNPLQRALLTRATWSLLLLVLPLTLALWVRVINNEPLDVPAMASFAPALASGYMWPRTLIRELFMQGGLMAWVIVPLAVVPLVGYAGVDARHKLLVTMAVTGGGTLLFGLSALALAHLRGKVTQVEDIRVLVLLVGVTALYGATCLKAGELLRALFSDPDSLLAAQIVLWGVLIFIWPFFAVANVMGWLGPPPAAADAFWQWVSAYNDWTGPLFSWAPHFLYYAFLGFLNARSTARIVDYMPVVVLMALQGRLLHRIAGVLARRQNTRVSDVAAP